ncbi:hypothetical protein EYF80_007295 [Liparis tanakae]|uniref:Uncharacterized protein n=1 Tax=Liparis tanakae TaxID=230148 RepID=A0A4Z2IWW4_9TELE|nr:hypothetical protein EYF80_007295 [Liparis tanakae]
MPFCGPLGITEAACDASFADVRASIFSPGQSSGLLAPGDLRGEALTWLYGLPLPALLSAIEGEETWEECGEAGHPQHLSLLELPLGDHGLDVLDLLVWGKIAELRILSNNSLDVYWAPCGWGVMLPADGDEPICGLCLLPLLCNLLLLNVGQICNILLMLLLRGEHALGQNVLLLWSQLGLRTPEARVTRRSNHALLAHHKLGPLLL